MKFEVIKKFFKSMRVPFEYCPKIGDWIKINDKWHHFIEFETGEYFLTE